MNHASTTLHRRLGPLALHSSSGPCPTRPWSLPRRSVSATAKLERDVEAVTGLKAPAVTEGQRLRGHMYPMTPPLSGDGETHHNAQRGAEGWKGAGLDLANGVISDPKLQELLLTYGELCQATYDNLGMDSCDKETYGYATTKYHQPTSSKKDILSYLTADYSLDPVVNKPDGLKGTRDKYTLPKADGLNPIIHALPGTELDAHHRDVAPKLLSKAFSTVSGFLVGFLDENMGGYQLFTADPATGRGKVQRDTFFGYIAVSEPSGPDNEVDVAVVWRGTIFKEEWESNFSGDELVRDRGESGEQEEEQNSPGLP